MGSIELPDGVDFGVVDFVSRPRRSTRAGTPGHNRITGGDHTPDGKFAIREGLPGKRKGLDHHLRIRIRWGLSGHAILQVLSSQGQLPSISNA
jgi:hypothetical protein